MVNDATLRGQDQIGEVEESSEADRHAAALTVCRHATDASDAEQLLAMLGLTRTRRGRIAAVCRGCGRAMSNLDGVGHARRGSSGMCLYCSRTEEVSG